MPAKPYVGPNEDGGVQPPEQVAQLLRELWQSIRASGAAIPYEEFAQLLLQVATRYQFGSPLPEPPRCCIAAVPFYALCTPRNWSSPGHALPEMKLRGRSSSSSTARRSITLLMGSPDRIP